MFCFSNKRFIVLNQNRKPSKGLKQSPIMFVNNVKRNPQVSKICDSPIVSFGFLRCFLVYSNKLY